MNRALVGQPSWLPVLRASLPAEHLGGRDAARTGRLEACPTFGPRFMAPIHVQILEVFHEPERAAGILPAGFPEMASMGRAALRARRQLAARVAPPLRICFWAIHFDTHQSKSIPT